MGSETLLNQDKPVQGLLLSTASTAERIIPAHAYEPHRTGIEEDVVGRGNERQGSSVVVLGDTGTADTLELCDCVFARVCHISDGFKTLNFMGRVLIIVSRRINFQQCTLSLDKD